MYHSIPHPTVEPPSRDEEPIILRLILRKATRKSRVCDAMQVSAASHQSNMPCPALSCPVMSLSFLFLVQNGGHLEFSSSVALRVILRRKCACVFCMYTCIHAIHRVDKHQLKRCSPLLSPRSPSPRSPSPAFGVNATLFSHSLVPISQSIVPPDLHSSSSPGPALVRPFERQGWEGWERESASLDDALLLSHHVFLFFLPSFDSAAIRVMYDSLSLSPIILLATLGAHDGGGGMFWR